mmetsp:Transcript_12414/g.19655  ORF Transcript_12414/g.19655 Transcript_12414/m.19655 type:complete len:97 (+) Transcript_12414:474-764(+)
MCTELGPTNTYMQEYIEEASGASLCNVSKQDKCDEKQTEFIKKWRDKGLDELTKQLVRLKGMVDKDGSSMKPEALKWVKQRSGIVAQLAQVQKAEL